MKIAADRDLYSLGHLSATYQEHPRTIEAALESIGAGPELSLNGLRYFAVTDEQDAQLRSLFAELADTRRANTEQNKGAAWTSTLPIPEGFRPYEIPKTE